MNAPARETIDVAGFRYIIGKELAFTGKKSGL